MTTSYSADALLEEVRRLGSFSSTAATGLADADLLADADSELRDTLVPLMLGVSEELYERVFDQTVTSGVAGYRINKRAAVSRINTVQWINTTGSQLNLARVEPKRVLELSTITTGGIPWAYYLEGSRVVLFPTPNTTGTLRVRAFVRPARLVLLADTNVLAITTVSVGATTTTLTTATHSIATTATRDLVAGTPSFEHVAVDATVTQASSTTVTILNTDCTTSPAVGDYMCVSDYTPFVQLPVELHPALFELTVARKLRALGKLSEASAHGEEAARLVAIGIQALTPRVDTADRKVVGGPMFRRRGYGVLRGGW